MEKNRVDSYIKDNPFAQLSDVVFNLLADDISSLNLEPGTKLNISKISYELEVSRTPVREAILKLNDAGYVKQFTDKHGYFVSGMNINDIKKIYLIRTIIESKAAFVCAKYKKNKDFKELEKLTDKIKKPYDNLDKITSCDYNFHKQIVALTENEYLIDFYSLIENKIKRILKSNLNNLILNNQIYNLEIILTEHKAILSALKQNMPEIAEKEMLNHINTAFNDSLLFSQISII